MSSASVTDVQLTDTVEMRFALSQPPLVMMRSCLHKGRRRYILQVTMVAVVCQGPSLLPHEVLYCRREAGVVFRTLSHLHVSLRMRPIAIATDLRRGRLLPGRRSARRGPEFKQVGEHAARPSASFAARRVSDAYPIKMKNKCKRAPTDIWRTFLAPVTT